MKFNLVNNRHFKRGALKYLEGSPNFLLLNLISGQKRNTGEGAWTISFKNKKYIKNHTEIFFYIKDSLREFRPKLSLMFKKGRKKYKFNAKIMNIKIFQKHDLNNDNPDKTYMQFILRPCANNIPKKIQGSINQIDMSMQVKILGKPDYIYGFCRRHEDLAPFRTCSIDKYFKPYDENDADLYFYGGSTRCQPFSTREGNTYNYYCRVNER